MKNEKMFALKIQLTGLERKLDMLMETSGYKPMFNEKIMDIAEMIYEVEIKILEERRNDIKKLFTKK